MDKNVILSRYHRWSADIARNYRYGIYINLLAPIVNADILLADITSMPHKAILHQYQT